ncbi:MAG TPA: glycosyl transferase [Bacteroidales bacterium]|nr:glycosyl transferase [Bacteroidales bacterium]
MKLLQVSSTLNTSAIGRIAEEIGQMAMKRGHESYVAYSDIGAGGSKSKIIKVGNKLDFYTHAFKTRVFDLHGYGSKSFTKKLIRKIERINPDVIGIHNVHGYYLNMRILFDYLKAANKPVVYTLHDCWSFTGHCCYFDFVGCDRWKTGCFDCPSKRAYPASWFVDRSKENYAEKKVIFNGVENLTLVTPSDWLAKLVKQSFLSGYPLQVINNGVNTDVFKPVNQPGVREKYGIGNKKMILGVAYIWSHRKGLDEFIKLSKLLPSEYLIFLVGLKTEQINSLPDNIRGIARTENVEELAGLYSNADVFVNPTWQDNFPTTNIEALACGTPVITYNTGGSPEAIDKLTGIVVEKGDINGLKIAIETIGSQDRKTIRKNCRERALKLFNKDDRFMDYLKLYEGLVK